MKFINNYILEKLKVTSDTKINKDYSNMDINELINLIFPIEEHEDLWENCKWCIEKKSRPVGKNEDMYTYDTYINFNDEILFKLNVIYYEISQYGSIKIQGPFYHIYVNRENVDYFANDKLKKLIFKNTTAEKIINNVTKHTQYFKDVNDQNINDYVEVFTDILEKYAKDNRVKSLKELNIK